MGTRVKNVSIQISNINIYIYRPRVGLGSYVNERSITFAMVYVSAGTVAAKVQHKNEKKNEKNRNGILHIIGLMMGWQPDVVCDNTHAQQITVHLRSVRPRKLAHVTDIFFSPSPPPKKHVPATAAVIAIFIFETSDTRTTIIPDASGQQRVVLWWRWWR